MVRSLIRLTLILTAGQIQAYGAPQYSISKLAGHPSLYAGINNRGQAVVSITGDADSDGEIAYIADGGSVFLPFLDGYSPHVGRINNAGEVVGAASTPDGVSRAFFFDGMTLVDLGPLGGRGSWALGINDRGDIVGERYFDNYSEAFILHDNGLLEVLPTLGGDWAVAASINGLGHVVGASATANGTYEAFFYNGSSILPLGTLGGFGSGAGSINEAGDIVGQAAVPSGHAHAAYFVVGGAPIDLAPAWYASAAADINAFGQIVGNVRAALDSGPQAALFGIGQTPILLRDLIPISSGWNSLLWANDINDFGQIVGVGNLSGEPGLQAFVMTPVPEPSSLWILAGFLPFCRILRTTFAA